MLDLPLIIEITLVSNNLNQGFLATYLPYIIYPFGEIIEGVRA
jgi:hypothetical protein